MNTSALILTSITMLLLTSCGGGTTTVAEGGIGGTGISAGKVSGYGSIFVNGIEFQTDTANFIIEEGSDSYTQADIKLGMVVQVTYDDIGNATQVEYSDQLEGLVNTDSVLTLDADGVGTLDVMGQSVFVDQTTVFDYAIDPNLLITELVANDVVEVSGFSDGKGTIYATRVELKRHDWPSSGGSLEIKGIVTNLNSTTFEIGNLVIDHSNAVLDFYNLEDGLYVEVQGDSFTAGQFQADVIELEGDGDLQIAPDDTEVELEGVITSDLVDDQFSLNGQAVSIADLTLQASEIDKLVIGSELKVEGTMVDGVILATEIEIEASESELQEIGSTLMEDPTNLDINTGSILLLGQSIAITSSTIMEDDLDSEGDDQTFNLDTLSVGDYVEVDVYQDSTGLVAVKLEREDVRVTDKIEGVVEAVDDLDPYRILVMGIVIDLSDPNIPTTDYPAAGDRVEVSGNYVDTILWAESLEFDD